jgi:succinate-semialdehyde dehydrogenase/glutarate-semialdehyde dehydrogenase/succinyl-CoA reductase
MRNNDNNKNKNKIITINPATEEILQEYDIISKNEIKEKVKNAKYAFKTWKHDIEERTSYIVTLAEEFSKRKEELARICTIIMWNNSV